MLVQHDTNGQKHVKVKPQYTMPFYGNIVTIFLKLKINKKYIKWNEGCDKIKFVQYKKV